MVAMAAVLGCLVVAVSGAWAAQVNLCVPSTAGQPITSNGSGTSCASGKTAVALPSSAADQATLIAVLPHLSFSSSGVDGKPTIRITGVNVQLEDGAGSTAAVNGEGNLVIGYDQTPGPGGQSGSHNLVLGSAQAYTSYGSIIGGSDNYDAGSGSMVLGYNNAVTGPYGSITGGRLGTASGSMSSVQGGYNNQASTAYASVAGGCDNLAGTGSVGSVPSMCSAASSFAEVAGGEGNQASANNATVAGGGGNSASGPESSVTGGLDNFASGGESSVTGGTGNTASGGESSVMGGWENNAGGPFSSIAAGALNQTQDEGAFIGAGCDNAASIGFVSAGKCVGNDEAILGGRLQTFSDEYGTYPAGP